MLYTLTSHTHISFLTPHIMSTPLHTTILETLRDPLKDVTKVIDTAKAISTGHIGVPDRDSLKALLFGDCVCDTLSVDATIPAIPRVGPPEIPDDRMEKPSQPEANRRFKGFKVRVERRNPRDGKNDIDGFPIIWAVYEATMALKDPTGEELVAFVTARFEAVLGIWVAMFPRRMGCLGIMNLSFSLPAVFGYVLDATTTLKKVKTPLKLGAGTKGALITLMGTFAESSMLPCARDTGIVGRPGIGVSFADTAHARRFIGDGTPLFDDDVITAICSQGPAWAIRTP